MEVAGRVAGGGQVTRLRELSVTPRAHFLQPANGAVLHQLPGPVEVLILVALRADLGGELVLVLEIVGADHAGFLDAVGERLFAVDMLAAIHGPVGDERVHVIGGAADHRLNVLLVKAFAPVNVLLSVGKLLRAECQVLLVHVAQGDDILAGDTAEMGFAPAPGADEGDV